MQKNTGNTGTRASPFNSSNRPAFRSTMFPSMFGGEDPFDDPFFSRPCGSLFGSDTFSSNSLDNLQQTSKLRGPVIKELDSDAEEEEANDIDAANRNPLIEHPEDQTNDHGKHDSNGREVSYLTNYNKANVMQPQTRSVSFQRVTYGGINGAYYTANTSRRTGSDGEESRQADRTSGQATHRVSRGIHDKGHSVTRKLDSDGKVDVVQTLHNLEEDELAGFEQAWGANTDRSSHGWNDKFDFNANFGTSGSRLGVPWGEFSHSTRGPGYSQNQSAGGKPKKVVRINIE